MRIIHYVIQYFQQYAITHAFFRHINTSITHWACGVFSKKKKTWMKKKNNYCISSKKKKLQRHELFLVHFITFYGKHPAVAFFSPKSIFPRNATFNRTCLGQAPEIGGAVIQHAQAPWQVESMANQVFHHLVLQQLWLESFLTHFPSSFARSLVVDVGDLKEPTTRIDPLEANVICTI